MKYLTECSSCISNKPHRCQYVTNAALLFILLMPITNYGTLQGEIPSASVPPGSGLINPGAIQWNPASHKVYSVDTDHNSVSICDDRTHSTREVKVGAAPVSIAVNTHTGKAYVANAGDGTISILDGNSDLLTATVQVGVHPYSIVVNSITNQIYVSHTFNDDLTIVDGSTNQASSLKLGSSDLLIVDEKSNLLYQLGYEGGTLKILDGNTKTVLDKSVGSHAWGMALDPASGILLVAKSGDSQLAILPPSSDRPYMVPTGSIPCAIAVDPRTGSAYVVNYGEDSVTAIDYVKHVLLATIHTGTHPQAIAFDSTTNRIYVANTHSNTVTAIDSRSKRVIATMPAGIKPYAIVVNPESGLIHVANLGQQASTILRPQDYIKR